MAPGSGAGLPVDEAKALRFQPPEGLGQFLHGPGHMVQPRTAPPEEAPDGGVLRQRLQKFYGAHQEDPDALIGKLLRDGTGDPLQAFIEGPGRFQGGDGDPQVVEGVEGRADQRNLFCQDRVETNSGRRARRHVRRSLPPVSIQIKERSWPRARTS
jgi:hypothetical protein